MTRFVYNATIVFLTQHLFSIPRFNFLLHPLAPLSIETIEFTTLVLCKVQNFIKPVALSFLVKNCGLKDNRYQYWQLSILPGIKNPKKLLSPLNSPCSICAKYKIESKLEDLPFLVQNCDKKGHRCQYRQVSILTGIKNHKKFCHH